MGHNERRLFGVCLAMILLMTGQGCGSAPIDGELALNPDNPISDGPTPSDDVEPVVARVEVASHQVVLAGIGASQQLVATPVDEDGDPVAGEVVVWSSLDPDIVSVTDDGLATTEAVGMAKLVAEVPGSGIATKVRVSTSLPAPGTILVDPAHKLAEPALLEAGPEETAPFGARMEVVLSHAAPALAAGDLLIFTDWSLSAEVDAVEVRANDVRVELTVAPYDGGFEALELRFDYTLDELIFRGATGAASGGAERGSAVAKALASASPINVSLDGNAKLFDLGPFKCTTPIATLIDASSIVSTVEPTVLFQEIDSGFSLLIENFEVVELRFAPYVEMRVDLNGDLTLGDALNGVMKCKFTDPLSPTIPPGTIETPPSTLGYVEIPHGFGFELVALAETQGTRLRFDGFVVASMHFGFAYTADEGWETINERSLDQDNLSVQTLPSDLTGEDNQTSELVATLFTFVSSKAKVGVPGFTVSRTIETFETGFELSAQVGNANAQVRDPLFRSEAELYVYAERKMKDANFFLGGLNIMFPGALLVTTALDAAVDIESFFGWEFAAELGRTPLGSMAPDGDFDEGESTGLRVSLDAAELDFWGTYQIDRVEVHRVSGSGGTMETHPFLTFGASEGQSSFDWEITPTESDVEAGEIRLVAFAYSTEFPGVPLQLTEVTTYDVYEADDPVFEIEASFSAAASVRIEDRDVFPFATIYSDGDQDFGGGENGSLQDVAQVTLGDVQEGVAFSFGATSSGQEVEVSFDLVAGSNAHRIMYAANLNADVSFELRGLDPGSTFFPVITLVEVEAIQAPEQQGVDWGVLLDIDGYGSGQSDDGSGTRAQQAGQADYEEVYEPGNGSAGQWVPDDDDEDTALNGYQGGGRQVPLGAVVVGSDGELEIEAQIGIRLGVLYNEFEDTPTRTLKGRYRLELLY